MKTLNIETGNKGNKMIEYRDNKMLPALDYRALCLTSSNPDVLTPDTYYTRGKDIFPSIKANKNGTVVESAWSDGELVGAAIGYRIPHEGLDVNTLQIVVVNPNFTGRGIATSLLSRYKQSCKDYGDINTIVVFDCSGSETLYRRAGFKYYKGFPAAKTYKGIERKLDIGRVTTDKEVAAIVMKTFLITGERDG